MSAAPTSRARRRALLALVLAVLAFAALEVGLRLVVLPNKRLLWRPLPPFDGLSTEEQRAWLARSEQELAEGKEPAGYGAFDAVLGWTNRPSSSSPNGKVHVNARGLRGTREYADEPPPGTRRFALCGDSFTFCEEVGDAEAWPAQVEALDPSLELWNYGVGGYGTDQALLRLSREAHGAFEAVIAGLLLENIGRNVNRYRPRWYPSALPCAKPRYVVGTNGLDLVPQPYGTRAAFVAAVRSGAVLTELEEHERWGDARLPGWLAWSATARLAAWQRAYAERDVASLWRDTEGEPFRTTVALLEALRGVARGLGGARLLVLIFPTRQDLRGLIEDGERPWSTLHLALEQLEIEFLDLADPLAEAAREAGSADALYLTSHLDARANAVVAKAVRERLAQAEAAPQSK